MINESIIWAVLNIENEDDRNFIAELYDNYYSLIKNTIIKTLKIYTDEIKDLIHNVIVQLIKRISLLRSFDNYTLTSYIAVVSKNIAINFMKHNNIKSDYVYDGDGEDIIDSVIDNNNAPEELIIIQEDSEHLNKILYELPEKHRLILQFKYFYEMGDEEIAEIFDIKPKSVKVYISRARKMTYKLFKESGADNSESK